jgi:hypothetical protein
VPADAREEGEHNEHATESAEGRRHGRFVSSGVRWCQPATRRIAET